mgnify:CR=1 FL=1|tara:strand:+ start:436 stop:1479 length:1044 start_codon:yes stop_codon:yes gene_type:complete
MSYTGINKSSNFMNTKLYTGNGSNGHAITGVEFQPDWTWIKARGGTQFHNLVDSVRGPTKILYSNNTEVETTDTSRFTSFDTDGFTLANDADVNGNSATFASWNWKAGTTGSGNTTGSGTYKAYSYSVNTTSGFSIVKYKGNGTSGHQIPHHLGVSPSMTIIKKTSGAENWIVQNAHRGWDKRLILDVTNAEASHTDFVSGVSSTTFSLYTNGSVNTNDADYIAYVFAEKIGYSKINSYLGNGNSGVNGPFINIGFKPAFVMIKQATGTGNWGIIDNKRPGYNQSDKVLKPNTNEVEATGWGYHDLLSNGFKMTGNDVAMNANGQTYIYMAFGQSIVGTNNIPATAR